MELQGLPRWSRAAPARVLALALLVNLPSFVGQAFGRDLRRGRLARASFEEKREALKACLAREYRSFFRPFEADFYADDVSFTDPLNQLKGKASYKANVEMLSGESLVGNILFCDAFIDLHGVEEVPGDATRLRTRWTLGFGFQLLPWRPRALFSGVSEYRIDPVTAQVLSQRDYWDTLSLRDGGDYASEPPLGGVKDLVAQLLPSPLKPLEAQEPSLAQKGGWALLRRAHSYRVYRCDGGEVVAIPAPSFTGSDESLRKEMEAHGLSVGLATRREGLQVFQLLEHPWKASEPQAAR